MRQVERLHQAEDKRRSANRLHKIKKQLAILQSDQKLGMINHKKIKDATTIPQKDPAAAARREQIDPDNFMELKRFVNKYRDKLVIKTQTQ